MPSGCHETQLDSPASHSLALLCLPTASRLCRSRQPSAQPCCPSRLLKPGLLAGRDIPIIAGTVQQEGVIFVYSAFAKPVSKTAYDLVSSVHGHCCIHYPLASAHGGFVCLATAAAAAIWDQRWTCCGEPLSARQRHRCSHGRLLGTVGSQCAAQSWKLAHKVVAFALAPVRWPQSPSSGAPRATRRWPRQPPQAASLWCTSTSLTTPPPLESATGAPRRPSAGTRYTHFVAVHMVWWKARL